LSSTTDRQTELGQILVVFAGGLVTLLLFAALAFDGGMLVLERRDQQNAADASALAGVRYVKDPVCFAAPSIATCPAAYAAAVAVATANGYTDGLDAETVDVNIPPVLGPNAGQPGFIEVIIGSTEPSLFARVAGILSWDVRARGVAANGGTTGGNFGLLALDPFGCSALKVTGQGQVVSKGNIQVNSACDPAIQRTGSSFISIDTDTASCNSVGDVHEGGGGYIEPPCNTDAQSLADPLGDVGVPAVPPYPLPPLHIGGALPSGDTVPANGIPKGCQGTVEPVDPTNWYPAATWDEPAKCEFDGSYAGTTWRLYPGYYPGGLKLLAGTFYLEPGIFYLGGGGAQFGGNGASVWSVNPASGDAPVPVDPDNLCPPAGCPDFGVLLYNTEAQDDLGDPNTTADDVLVHDWCQDLWVHQNLGGTVENFPNPDPLIVPNDDPTTSGVNEYTRWFDFRCMGVIRLNGSSAPISLYPLKVPDDGSACDGGVDPAHCFNNLVIYQNRFLNLPGDDVILNGNDSDLLVRGTIYVPFGDVRANGNNGTVTLDQVIAWRFSFSGNAGSIDILNNNDFVFQFEVVGLVE